MSRNQLATESRVQARAQASWSWCPQLSTGPLSHGQRKAGRPPEELVLQGSSSLWNRDVNSVRPPTSLTLASSLKKRNSPNTAQQRERNILHRNKNEDFLPCLTARGGTALQSPGVCEEGGRGRRKCQLSECGWVLEEDVLQDGDKQALGTRGVCSHRGIGGKGQFHSQGHPLP